MDCRDRRNKAGRPRNGLGVHRGPHWGSGGGPGENRRECKLTGRTSGSSFTLQEALKGIKEDPGW